MPRVTFNSLPTTPPVAVFLLAGLFFTVSLRGQPGSAVSPTAASPSAKDAELLLAEKPVTRKVAGGEVHLYQVQMKPEQYLSVVVDQIGIDLTVAAFGPAGGEIAYSDLTQTERGAETISLITNDPGLYRLEIRSNRKTDTPASYGIKIERLEAASALNRATNAAAALIAEANRLLGRRTKDSPAEAITKYEMALRLLDESNDFRMKAIVLNKIGRACFSLGDYRKSLDYHNQALPLARDANDRWVQASTLSDLGQAYRLIPENDKAITSLNQALELWRLIDDRRGELDALNKLGRSYYSSGEVHKALICFDQALELSRVLADQDAEITTLNGTAGAYYILGEFERAGEIWKEALILARAQPGRGMEMVFLSKLGSVSHELGEIQQALAYLDQAIALARELRYVADEAAALQTKGRVYRSIAEYRKAIDHLEQSLVLLKGITSPGGVARAHYNLGKVYTDLGEYDKALDYLNQALAVWRARNDPINIAATIRELARAERGRGNLSAALAQTDAAINVIETVRAGAGEPDLRASYLSIVQNCFELRIDVLMRLHKLDPSKDYAALALQTSERARARSLLETLAEAGVDIRRGIAPDLLNRERTISEQLSAKASEQARLLSSKPAPAVLAQVNKEIKELTAQLERVEAQIRSASPDFASLSQTRPLNLGEIREHVIAKDTLLLEYYLGQERSYLWAVTATSIQSYELPKRAAVETAARQVYGLLTARNRRVKFETSAERQGRVARADADYSEAATALSHIVLGPVAGQLANKRLLIVGDGALQFVPFAALPVPANVESSFRPLALTNEVVSLPSASTLAVLRRGIARRPPAPMTVAVLADPVFDDSDQRVKDSLARNQNSPANTVARSRRLISTRGELERSASESGWNGEGLSMNRLPFTRREADAITTLVPAADRKEQLDFSASLTNAKSPELSQYRIVHFATHGFLNSRHPALSGIVLSLVDEKGQERDGFLRAHAIYNLNLPAELIVLSGCRTGLGKEIRGEGLVGLTGAFMHAGAARVLVSLWDVHDEATAELMTRFYGRMLGPEKLSPAAALRAAQTSMAQDKRWSAPYFWAGFALQGEPR